MSENPTITILCVDDEVNILSAMRRLFRPAGYRVLIAESGEEGLQELEASKGEINLVISDMRMPTMDGATFLTEVYKRYPKIIRILLTGYSDMDSTVNAINEAHIYRYVSKPWNEEELLHTVKSALHLQEVEAEKERLEALTLKQNEELKDLNANLEAKVTERTAELRTAHERLKKAFMTTIKIFSNLIELRGGNVAGHSRRVADLAHKIGVKMGVEHKVLNDIFLAGLLHDIGKIGFSDMLLNKPPIKMSADERSIYCQHPVKGEQLLMPLEDLHNAAKLIRHHHEHFAGTGYPEGLAGEQIPIGSRILALANEFDGLTEGFLTGKKQTILEVREYIQKDGGKRYDPKVVAAFFEVMWPAASSPSPVANDLAENEKRALALQQGKAKEITIAIQALKPGMKLAHDLFSEDGVMLLAADFTLDNGLIDKLLDFVAQHRGKPKTVQIYEPLAEESPAESSASPDAPAL